MTSQINPNNIDGNYPVAGVPNNTQGMRDNFTNTRTNFQYAYDEITELQSKAVLKQALTGTTLDNNMNDSILSAVTLKDVGYSYVPVAATSGSVELDYSAGGYQQITPTGSISLSFTNWPASGIAGSLRVGINITNTAYTVTLPAAVSQGIGDIAGVSPGTPGVSNTITFGATGNYAFEFDTVDGGTTIWIFDDSRSLGKINNMLEITANTSSTSTTTGALQVDGGVGIVGNLNVGGDFVTYTSGGDPVFSAYAANGFVHINAPSIPANSAGALNIVGSADGAYQPVTQAGGMIHITGNDGVSARITHDAFGTAAIPTMTGRRARGTAASPTVPQSGDVLLRFAATGWNGSYYGPTTTTTPLPTALDIVATETYSGSAMGSKFDFYTAPTASNVRTLSASITSSVTTFPANVSVSGTGGLSLTDSGTLGYGTGAGGTVTQTGNKSTGVTLSKPAGEITMTSTNLAADTSVSFTLTNTTISNKDVMILNIVGGVVTAGCYNLDAVCNSGSAVITVRNITGGTLGEAIVLRYVIIKGATT